MKVLKVQLADLPAITKLNDAYFQEIRDFKKILASPEDYFYVGIVPGFGLMK
jgi:hypothetical protein